MRSFGNILSPVCRPLSRPPYLRTMPSRKHADEWVLALRNQLRISVGSAYRVSERRGKTKLDIRFQNGTRQYATLGIAWLPANSRKIQDSVEKIAGLVTSGRNVKEAYQAIFGSSPPVPEANESASSLLMQAWELFGAYKIRKNKITASTWKKDYATTGRRLKEVSEAKDAFDLLERAGEKWKAGSRQRQISLQHMAAMLKWGISREGNHILAAERWTPPIELKGFYGEKVEAKVDSVPLQDDEIISFLESLPIESKHPRDKEAAKRWKFAFQLMAAYGLRPIEIKHLQVEDGVIWCNYIKRSGGGQTKRRRLRCLNEWETEWNLLERVKTNEPLPLAKVGVADAARTYLKRHKSWDALAKAGKTSYSFRHGYALRCHQQYGLSVRIAAALMGHSTDTHTRSYGTWTDEDEIDKALERGKKYRLTIEAV